MSFEFFSTPLIHIIRFLPIDYIYEHNFNLVNITFKNYICTSLVYRRKLTISRVNISLIRDIVRNKFIRCDLSYFVQYLIQKIYYNIKYMNVLIDLLLDYRVNMFVKFGDFIGSKKIKKIIIDQSRIKSKLSFTFKNSFEFGFENLKDSNKFIILSLSDIDLSIFLILLYNKSGKSNIYRQNRRFMKKLLKKINIDIVGSLFHICFNMNEKHIYLQNAFKKNNIDVIGYIIRSGKLNLHTFRYKNIIDDYLEKYSYFQYTTDPVIKSTLYDLIEISELFNISMNYSI